MVGDELAQIVLVEGPVLQPLHRSDKGDLLGDRLFVRSDQVDLRVVGPRPVTSDRPGVLGQSVHATERLADERLDRGAAPRRPGTFDPLEDEVAAVAVDRGQVRSDEREPEAQVRVRDVVAAFPRRSYGQRHLRRHHALLLEDLQTARHRRAGQAAGLGDRRVRALPGADGAQQDARLGFRRELRRHGPHATHRQGRARHRDGRLQELSDGGAGRPFVQDLRQAAGNQVRVDGLRGGQAQLVRHVGGGERVDHHLRRAHVEGTVVLVDRLHDGQIGADQDEQHGPPGELAVEEALQGAFEVGVLLDQVRELVDDDDAR